MSDDNARFGLELVDKMSGPAEKIIGGLEGATGALEKLHGTSNRASEGMTKVGRAVEYMTLALRGIQIAHGIVELTKAFGGFDKLKGGIKSAGMAIRRFGVWAAQGLKRVAPFAAGGAGLYGLGKIAAGVTVPAMGLTAAGIGAVSIAATGAVLAVGYLGLKLAGLAYDGVKAAAGFATFGQNSRMAFNALAKYGASGDKLFQHAQGLAVEFGQDVMDTTDSFKKLLAGGFNPRLATDVIKLGADMRFLGSSAEEVKGAVRAITQIKAAGRLQGDELNQLAEAGIGANTVYAALGKQLGKTVPEVMKLKEAGKIDSKTAIGAILEAVKTTTGEKELGDMGRDWADHAIDGMVGKLKARGQVLMMSIGDSLAPTLSRLAHGAIDWVDLFVKSGRAEALVNKIGDTFSAVGDTLTKVMPLAGKFLDAFGSEAAKAFGNLSQALTGMNSANIVVTADAFERMGRGLAQVVVYGGAALAAVGALYGAFVAAQGFIYDVFIGYPLKFFDIGVNMALGLARGIKNGVVYVVSAIEDMGASAVNRLKGFLDVRSPSRVFGQVGAYSAMGFALGISSNAGLAADASRQMAAGAVQASQASAAEARPGAASTAAGSDAMAPGAVSAPAAPGAFSLDGVARSVSVRFGDVIVQAGGASDPNEIAAATTRTVHRAIDDYFRAFDNEA